ncbi:unnamed protein product [Polarella glacialis]|uniref:GST N-terminal domain-containing protein n=1 Tax=Polarella glacialis TaxID=89957 RepID=A0A813GPH1_POLGL|nr:unnamed protein product [Polarella glacialis]
MGAVQGCFDGLKAPPRPKSSMTLKYFPISGRAEPIRLALLLGKFQYYDQRIEGEEWEAKHKKGTPFGQLPILVVDGKQLSQTKAILRYIGKLSMHEGHYLYPQDPLQAAKVDEVMDAFDDLWILLAPTYRIEDAEQKAEARRRLFADGGEASAMVAIFEGILSQSSNGFAVPEAGFTVADLMYFSFLNVIRSGFVAPPRTWLTSACNVTDKPLRATGSYFVAKGGRRKMEGCVLDLRVTPPQSSDVIFATVTKTVRAIPMVSMVLSQRSQLWLSIEEMLSSGLMLQELRSVSPLVAVLGSFSLSLIFVLSLYVWKFVGYEDKNRDAPGTIQRRFLSAILSCFCSALLVRLLARPAVDGEIGLSLPELLGLRCDGQLYACLSCLLLTAVLFVGPLVQHFTAVWDGEAEILSFPGGHWIMARNLILAPVTEVCSIKKLSFDRGVCVSRMLGSIVGDRFVSRSSHHFLQPILLRPGAHPSFH